MIMRMNKQEVLLAVLVLMLIGVGVFTFVPIPIKGTDAQGKLITEDTYLRGKKIKACKFYGKENMACAVLTH